MAKIQKYLTSFRNASDYEEAKVVGGVEYPNVSYIESTETSIIMEQHPKKNLVDEEGLRAIGWDDDDILTLMNHVWWTEEEVDDWKVEPETIELYKTKKTWTSSTDINYVNNTTYFYAKFFPKLTITWGCNGCVDFHCYAFPKLIHNSTVKPSSFVFNRLYNLKYVIVKDLLIDIKIENLKRIAFTKCSSLIYADLNGVNLPNFKECQNMFSDCIKLERVDGLEDYIVSSVTRMDTLFGNAYNLKYFSVDGWNTENVTLMNNVFSLTANVEKLDLSHFNTSNVENISSIFSNCQAREIDISGWDLSSCTSATYFVYNCPYLEVLRGADIDISNISDTNQKNLFSGNSHVKYIYDSNGGFQDLFKGLKASMNISSSNEIIHDSLVGILNGLATVTTAQTLTLGNTNLNKLTDEEKAIATNKGWTLA